MHEALDPEYSILKQRLARRMRYEGMTEKDVEKMDLVQITKVSACLPLATGSTFANSWNDRLNCHYSFSTDSTTLFYVVENGALML